MSRSTLCAIAAALGAKMRRDRDIRSLLAVHEGLQAIRELVRTAPQDTRRTLCRIIRIHLIGRADAKETLA